jgi:hypothetical protein
MADEPLSPPEHLSHHRAYGSRTRRFARYQYSALFTKIPSALVYDMARLSHPKSFHIELQANLTFSPFRQLADETSAV